MTPFLNKLAHDNQTFYFDNFFHQTGQGKTSDAEFMMENSLYPLSQGSVFVNKAQNTPQSVPAILKGKSTRLPLSTEIRRLSGTVTKCTKRKASISFSIPLIMT